MDSKTAASKPLKEKGPGEEGESRPFGLFLDGHPDQQLAGGVSGPTRGGLPLPRPAPRHCSPGEVRARYA